jgi:ribosome maturation factor RimP
MNRGDINKFKGKDVNVDYQGNNTEMTKVSGKLVDIDNEEITIDYKEGVVDIPIVLIKRIELDKQI